MNWCRMKFYSMTSWRFSLLVRKPRLMPFHSCFLKLGEIPKFFKGVYCDFFQCFHLSCIRKNVVMLELQNSQVLPLMYGSETSIRWGIWSTGWEWRRCWECVVLRLWRLFSFIRLVVKPKKHTISFYVLRNSIAERWEFVTIVTAHLNLQVCSIFWLFFGSLFSFSVLNRLYNKYSM